jgi:YYY domain-containing protein
MPGGAVADTPFEATGARGRTLSAERAFALARSWPVLLAVILLVGASLRFHGLDWDVADGAEHPSQMHPDERFLSLVSAGIDWPDSVGGYFDTERSTLNPYNDGRTNSYVYGTLPLFLGKLVSTIAGDDQVDVVGDGYDDTVVWGRRLTAAVDTLTILLVFLAGWALMGRGAGLVGAGLYALAVLPTQLAHFWTVDPYLTFFAALALLLGALLLRSRSLRRSALLYAALGIAVGLAAACKVNGAIFLVIPVAVTAMRWALRDDQRLGLRWQGQLWPASRHSRDDDSVSPDADNERAETAAPPSRGRRAAGGEGFGHWMNDLSLLCVGLALGLVAFRIAQPYAFTGPNWWDTGVSDRWWDDIRREYELQSGNGQYPPTFQWAGRTPILWPVQNLVLWGLGPTLALAGMGATVAGAVLMFRRRELSFLLPLAVIATVFAFHSWRFVAYMRYFEPMLPALCVLTGWALVELWRFGRASGATGWRSPALFERLPARARDGRILRGAALGAVLIVGAATAWWALAFQSIYTQEQTRLEASRWIYDNLPTGTRITGEYWDDTIPYPVPNPEGKQFPLVATDPYMLDSPDKVRQLVYGLDNPPPGQDWGRGLDGADYVAISSNRIRDSVTRLPAKYPATIRYYELLESGELGFDLVRSWQVHPTLLGIAVDDSRAEESFTVYDHPEVRLYKKSDRWDPERALALLMEARPEAAIDLLPRQGNTNGLMFTPGEAAAQQSGGTFTDVFDADGLFSTLPWLWWLVWLQLAAFASVPWVTWLFRALPDRGYALSKVLGLIAVVLPTWLIVAWDVADFSAALAWLVFGVALATGTALAWYRRDALRADLAERWRAIAAVEVLFLGVFLFFLALRAFNPDLWHHPQGGEKPVEIAYLTAVIRSTNLPPYDPWLSGGVMNYYYMGWFFLAVPVRALRIMPEVAFNLGVPTFAALAATVMYSSASNLVALSARARVKLSGGGSASPTIARRPAILAGLLGAFLLVFIANFDPLHQTVERLQAVNDWSAFEGVPVVGGAVGLVGGTWNWAFEGADLPPFDWWRSSRVHIGTFDITEFPYFSFLFADLHAHLMGLPFFGLLIALVITYALNAREASRLRGWLLALLMGLVLGLIRTTHTWDFPTAVLIVIAGVAGSQLLAPGRWQQRFWDGAGHVALAAAVLVVAFAPYTSNFEVFNRGIIRSQFTTEPQQYFAQFGIFVLIALAFIAARYWEELRARDGNPGNNVLLASVAGRFELLAVAIFATGLAAFTWRFDVTVVVLSATLLAYLGNLLWLEWRRRELDMARVIATALLMLAFAIAAGVDVVTVKGDIGRMNTVFKFGLQAWQLFALAGAYGAWYVWQTLSAIRSQPSAAGVPAESPWPRAMQWGAATLGALLLLSGSIYLWSGTNERQDARFAQLDPTLDGLAFLGANPVFVEDQSDTDPANDRPLTLSEDRPLIDWLRENVEGTPVIVESTAGLYHWNGRFANYTGLPTVIGWDWHEVAYRMDYAPLIQQRRLETEQFFEGDGTAAARDFVRKYCVSYVVVGTAEVATAPPESLARFDRMPDTLTRVFESGPYRIYAVQELPSSCGRTAG